MLQDGMVARNPRLFFEENTVIRLTKDLRSTASSGKVYLGLMLFDVPEDIQSKRTLNSRARSLFRNSPLRER